MSAVSVVVLIIAGVMLADLIQPAHVQGTKQLFSSVGNLWAIGVNGMLGQPTGANK